jgi:hypothetical protein
MDDEVQYSYCNISFKFADSSTATIQLGGTTKPDSRIYPKKCLILNLLDSKEMVNFISKGPLQSAPNLNQFDKFYLMYFALGDLARYRHCRKIRVEVSSIHRAEIDLVTALFKDACKPIIYHRTNGSGYCWRIVCHLDDSYSFLMNYKEEWVEEEFKDDGAFYQALSGFTDAEGYIGVQRARQNTRAGFLICN